MSWYVLGNLYALNFLIQWSLFIISALLSVFVRCILFAEIDFEGFILNFFDCLKLRKIIYSEIYIDIRIIICIVFLIALKLIFIIIRIIIYIFCIFLDKIFLF